MSGLTRREFLKLGTEVIGKGGFIGMGVGTFRRLGLSMDAVDDRGNGEPTGNIIDLPLVTNGLPREVMADLEARRYDREIDALKRMAQEWIKNGFLPNEKNMAIVLLNDQYFNAIPAVKVSAGWAVPQLDIKTGKPVYDTYSDRPLAVREKYTADEAAKLGYKGNLATIMSTTRVALRGEQIVRVDQVSGELKAYFDPERKMWIEDNLPAKLSKVKAGYKNYYHRQLGKWEEFRRVTRWGDAEPFKPNKIVRPTLHTWTRTGKYIGTEVCINDSDHSYSNPDERPWRLIGWAKSGSHPDAAAMRWFRWKNRDGSEVTFGLFGTASRIDYDKQIFPEMVIKQIDSANMVVGLEQMMQKFLSSGDMPKELNNVVLKAT